MIMRFSTFGTSIGADCFYALLAAHHAMNSRDMRQAVSNYNVSGKLGLIWC